MRLAIMEGDRIVNAIEATREFAEEKSLNFIEMPAGAKIGDRVISGVVQDEPTPKLTSQEYVSRIKALMKNRIVARVPVEAQGNIKGYIVGLLVKERAGITLSVEEEAEITTAASIERWVASLLIDGRRIAALTDYAAGEQQARALGNNWNSAWDTFVARF